MKKNCRRIFRILLWLGLTVVACILLTEFVGLPNFAVNALEKYMLNYGVKTEISYIRCGFLHGLVLDNVRLEADTRYGILEAQISQARLRLDGSGLLFGNIYVDTMEVKDLSASVENAEGNRFNLGEGFNLRLNAETDGRHVCTFNVLYEDIDISGTVNITSLDEVTTSLIKETPRKDTSENSVRADEEKEKLSLVEAEETTKAAEDSGHWEASVQNVMVKITDVLSKLERGPSKASLDIRGNVDAIKSEALRCTVYFDIGRLIYEDYPCEGITGNLTYENGLFQLNHAVVDWGQEEQLHLDASYDLTDNAVTADYSLYLKLKSVLEGFALDPQYVRYFGNDCGVRLSGHLDKMPLGEDMAVKADIEVDHLNIMGQSVPLVTAKVISSQTEVAVEDLVINMDVLEQNVITGKLNVSYESKKLDGKLEGRFPLGQFVRNTHLVATDFPLEQKQDIDFSLNLSGRVDDWKTLKGELTLCAQDIMLQNCRLDKASCRFVLNEGVAELDKLQLLRNEQGGNEIILAGKTDCRTWEESGDGDIAFSVFMQRQKGQDGALDIPVRYDGHFIWNIANDTIELADGRGTIFIDRFYETLHSDFGIEADILKLFTFNGGPATFSLGMKPFVPGKNANWQLEGDFAASNVEFDQMHVNEATCGFSVNSKGVVVTDIDGKVNSGERILIKKLASTFSPVILTIEDAHLDGDPRTLNNFIFSKAGKEYYMLPWQKFNWDDKKQTTVDISELKYNDGLFGYDWAFSMRSHINAEDAYFGSLSSTLLDTDIIIDLPGKLRVGPAVICTKNGKATADFNFNFTGVSRCTFECEDTEGAINLPRLATVLVPAWEEDLNLISVAATSAWKAKGFYEFGDPSRFEIRFGIQAPEVMFKNWQIKNTEFDVLLDEGQVRWNMLKGTFMDGETRTTGVYDLKQKKADILIRLKDLPIAKLVKGLSEEEVKNEALQSGKLRCETHFTLFRDWAKQPVYIEGGGHFGVSEGNLWKLPLFYQLGDLLSFPSFNIFSKDRDKSKNLGRISAADGDFQFVGDHVVFNEIVTDGTIFSLRGNGEYSWGKNQLHFSVSGEAMKHFGVLNFLLKPLMWTFTAELTGTPEDMHWHLQTPLKKIFFN